MYYLTIFLGFGIIFLVFNLFKLKTQIKSLDDKAKSNELLAKQKADFLATMSHEIRTPLNGILVASKLLSEHKLESQAEDCVDIINNSGALLLEVVNDILDYSKLDAGKLELDYRAMDLKKTVQGIIFVFTKQFESKGIFLRYDIASDVPEYIYSDENRIKQILFNLIGNAFKFTHVGGVTLNIMSRGEKLQFSVSDTGIGIKEESVDDLFDEYSQADLETQTKYGGTGLGLSISKKLTNLLGGTISASSILGKGTTFTFDINLEEAQKPVKKEISKVDKDFSKLSVLVADDNPINRKVAKMCFKKFGVEIDMAHDGDEALKMIIAKKYDIIYLDIFMPGLTGPEVSEKIFEQIPFNNMPLIYAVSANAFKEQKDKCFNAGMNGFIAKPMNFDKLEESLDLAVEKLSKTVA